MTKDGTQERTKLAAARKARGWSQTELADEIKCSREAISMWERGESTPHADYIKALCLLFGCNPADLDLASALTEDEMKILEEILKNKTLDRRQAVGIVALPAFAGIDLSELSKSSPSPGAFLNVCRAAINNCWYLLKHDGFTQADTVLNECRSGLFNLAAHSSNHQGLAASLAVEAKIIQGIIALHHLDYTRQESLYLEALHIGEISGNERLQAVPLHWLGWLYKSHHRLPKRGITFYKDAFARLDNGASFQRSACMYGLSGAYALDKKTRGKALDLLGEAKATMPKNHVQDTIDRLLDNGVAEFDMGEGIIYQNLHRLFPTENYGQMAYETFERAGKNQSQISRIESEILIHQACAALVLGELGDFVFCLEHGLAIAFQINSPKRKQEARIVLDNAPDAWKKEQAYQNLIKMF